MDLQHEERLSKVEERSKSNTHRLDELEKRQDNLDVLTKSVAEMAVKMEHQEGDLKEMKADIKTITGKSGRRWDSMVEKIMWAVVGAVIAVLLAKIGLA